VVDACLSDRAFGNGRPFGWNWRGTYHTPTKSGLIICKSFGYVTTVDESKMAILLAIRLPRVCLAVLVGSGLAISGAAIQGLFRNPLADPGLIGISAGASLAAVMMIVLEVSFFRHLRVFWVCMRYRSFRLSVPA
jgi:ABC-type Fe3+-siderophore transport system permease subunit